VNKWRGRIEENIFRRKLFSRGQSILVAVSGGLDSMVLLYLLHELSKTHHWHLTVAHFNHQLRGRSSDADERLVRKAAKDLKLRFVSDRADVKGSAKTNRLSLEMAARKLRHQFFAGTAKKLKIKTVALAHHADDQVELFFLRLFRGAGTEGLAGMKWKSPSPVDSSIQLVRPLLDQPKEILSDFAKSARIPFREDASNASRNILRNRIRHELVPLLKKNYQPALARTTLRAMEILGEESNLAMSSALDWLSKKSQSKFSKLPIAVQRRSLRLQLLSQKISADFELIESLRLNPGEFINVSGRCSLRRDSNGEIHVRPLESVPSGLRHEPQDFEVSGRRGEIVFDGLTVKWSVLPKAKKILGQTNCEFFDTGKVGTKISLRHWKSGDRFQPIGMKTPVKLQNIFTNLKIPQAERHERIVAVTERGEIFWVEGLRISERFKLDNQSARRLKWKWQRL
jgi:tRNA(Ile)-lysidine synthase